MMGYYSVNGKWEIWDTTFKETNNSVLTSLICIGDLIYSGGIFLIVVCWLRILQTKTDIVDVMNMILDDDTEYHLQYCETNFLVLAYEKSEAFLEAIKHHSREWARKNRKQILKGLRALKPLQGELAYPYFHLSRTSFIEFHSQTVDNLVSLLVSLKHVSPLLSKSVTSSIMNFWLVLFAFVTLSIACSRALPSPQRKTQGGLQWNGEYDDEEDEVDSEEKELIAIRNIFTSRLGLKNFTGSAIAEKAADAVVNYLNRNYLTPAPANPNPPPQVELKAVEEAPSTTPPAPVILTTMMNGSSAVIQIRFPPMMQHHMRPMEMVVTAPPQQSPPSKNPNDNSPATGGDPGLSNIEAAIVEALAQAQKMAIGNSSNSTSTSGSSASASKTRTKGKGSNSSKKPPKRDPLYGFGPMIDWFGKWVLRQGEDLLL
ncbi:unnamed protein product [Orchesella dallaii]|uniref:Uncharacterized protein n=1 Tax=Orchesella dallaii TaxID=48710 RepID=A0ABP1RI65_9HEXA